MRRACEERMHLWRQACVSHAYCGASAQVWTEASGVAGLAGVAGVASFAGVLGVLGLGGVSGA